MSGILLAGTALRVLGPPAIEMVLNAFSQQAEESKKYLESNPDQNTQIEKRRSAVLRRAMSCQDRISEIQQPETIVRSISFISAQISAIYSATNVASFGSIEAEISRLEAMLAHNKAGRETRASARRLAVRVTIGIVAALITFVSLSPYLDLSINTVIPIVQIPLPIIVWSCLGSLGAMLYRFNRSADVELSDPIRWSFTRPLKGVLMGVIAYLVFKVGILIVQSGIDGPQASTTSVPELLWLGAFLAGFSDRFADSVLRSLSGRLGGDGQVELLTNENVSLLSNPPTAEISERFGIVMAKIRARERSGIRRLIFWSKQSGKTEQLVTAPTYSALPGSDLASSDAMGMGR